MMRDETIRVVGSCVGCGAEIPVAREARAIVGDDAAPSDVTRLRARVAALEQALDERDAPLRREFDEDTTRYLVNRYWGGAGDNEVRHERIMKYWRSVLDWCVYRSAGRYGTIEFTVTFKPLRADGERNE